MFVKGVESAIKLIPLLYGTLFYCRDDSQHLYYVVTPCDRPHHLCALGSPQLQK